MKSLIQWALRNAPAMNMLFAALTLVGALSMARLRREVFPEFELDIVLVTVPYPGASPEEVEEGICQKIEESVRSVDGIKKQTAIAREGAGFLVLELESQVDVDKILNEVRSEIAAIPSLPELSEQPEVKQITFRIPAITVGVIAENTDDPEAEWRLRETAEKVRDDLLLLPAVSQANLVGGRDYQIDVEISEEALRKHGLTLQEVARVLRRENIELPGGLMRTRAEEVLMRGKNKQTLGSEIAKLPVLRDPSGRILTVGELGTVRDEFTDETAISTIDGRPGLAITVNRTSNEDLLAMAQQVRDYVDTHALAGYQLRYWNDQSIDVEDRLEMLIRNGLQGLTLVFLLLALFLDLRLAFWVAIGIPISIFASGGVLLQAEQTLNMLTMFAFMMALGIVVDDAIVIGENIYQHREQGKSFVQAAIDGTAEVVPSVVSSMLTTVIAFLPLAFVSGVMGKFIAVMPLAVIAVLTFSLFEAVFVLPIHLAHKDNLLTKILGIVLFPLRGLVIVANWCREHANSGLDWLIVRTYVPALHWSLRHTGIVVATLVALLITVFGFVRAGFVPFVIFPELDSRQIEARVVFPDGTPSRVTDEATRQLEALFLEINDRHASHDQPIMRVRQRIAGWMASGNDAAGLGGDLSGSHLGSVKVELVPMADRDVTSMELLDEWRREWTARYARRFTGAESVTFQSLEMGPGGQPIEFKLLAASDSHSVQQLEAAVEKCKAKLASYQGVRDVDDDSRPGKWEYQIRVKDDAKAMGVTVADLAETVRAAYYGEEVMRLQRGRHEVKLMVRYPAEDRRSLAAFDEIRVRTGDGAERPLTELADVRVTRGYSEINRLNQKRSITVLADINAAEGGNAREVVSDLQKSGFIDQLLAEYPAVSVRWEGQQEQTQESVRSLLFGAFVALFAMYVLLTLEFRSYLQPMLVMLIVPFGLVGAIVGHAVMGLDFTLFSMFGIVALTGVVVNDSIVMIDFINHERASGETLKKALMQAGRRRFRPVLLTSLTTIGGLMPIVLERSFQAQVIIPMAVAMSFGLAASTILVLILVPVTYQLYGRWALGEESTITIEDAIADTEEAEQILQHVPPTETPEARELVSAAK